MPLGTRACRGAAETRPRQKDLLAINAGIAKNIVEACASFCPDAVLGLIVNPVNSVVPAMCELWKKAGLDPRKICGVTSLDVVRANKFVSEVSGKPLNGVNVPVIGGHAGTTILPLLSQDPTAAGISSDQVPDLDKRIQDAGTEVVAKKNGKGSATLSMAYAAARFGSAVLNGLNGVETDECAYVATNIIPNVGYFASRVTFGLGGPVKIHPIGTLTSYESKRLADLVPVLKEEIQAGLDYAADQTLESPNDQFKVCVCGGAGGIGQPLSMLMALEKSVGELCVFDLNISMVPANGVATDLSHIDTGAKCTAYSIDKDELPRDKLEECLSGCDLVLVPAGVPRKPGQDRKDLLAINAGIAKNIVEACAHFCPEAVIGLIVNPVNSVVPAMCELWKKAGLDPRKICGVTSLDVVRANKFVHEVTGKPLDTINVPVIGGHAGTTILPLFSQDSAGKTIGSDQVPGLDSKVQDAGTEVVAKKNGKGSATLSMAYAAHRFGKAVLTGLSGEENVECAYINSTLYDDLPYFASRVTFGRGGPVKIHPVGDITGYEAGRLQGMKSTLKEEIDAGLDYAKTQSLEVRRTKKVARGANKALCC